MKKILFVLSFLAISLYADDSYSRYNLNYDMVTKYKMELRDSIYDMDNVLKFIPSRKKYLVDLVTGGLTPTLQQAATISGVEQRIKSDNQIPFEIEAIIKNDIYSLANIGYAISSGLKLRAKSIKIKFDYEAPNAREFQKKYLTGHHTPLMNKYMTISDNIPSKIKLVEDTIKAVRKSKCMSTDISANAQCGPCRFNYGEHQSMSLICYGVSLFSQDNYFGYSLQRGQETLQKD